MTKKILIIICLILVTTNIFTILHKKQADLVFKDKYPLLDPAREFYSPNQYVLNIQNLRDYLHGLEEKYPNSVSIYYEQLNSGANISVNKDLKLFPASLSKLVQAILITKKVEEGTLSWNTKLKAEAGDISSDSGTLYKTIGSKEMTVEELLSELLINSDNTAQNIFSHQLEIPDYLKFQDETGLQDLYNEKGFISAKEYTRILRVLYTSSFLQSENSQKILNYMSHATFRDYLSQGIPSGIEFAHKYGENTKYSIFSDSGIVYVPDKPYMLTVMIKGEDSSLTTRAWAVGLMKEISEHAYEASK